MESTLKVVNRLKDNRFVSVIGASGSGKSSLVLSGVIPALLRENAEGKKAWSYLVFRPGINPLTILLRSCQHSLPAQVSHSFHEASIAASLHNRAKGSLT